MTIPTISYASAAYDYDHADDPSLDETPERDDDDDCTCYGTDGYDD